VDSAQAYRNETAVGEAVRDSGIDRGELFISACHKAVQEMSFHPLPNVSDKMC
jgi:diketogulonate reductase-like aldo/keto reductase